MGAEDEGVAINIVEGSPEFTEVEALFRGAIVTNDIEGHVAQQGEISGGMVFTGAVSLLAELDIQDPMLGILDGPMVARTDR